MGAFCHSDAFPLVKRISRSRGRICFASIIRNGICRGQNIIGVASIAIFSPFKIALYATCLRFCAEIILYIVGGSNTSVCKRWIAVISPVIVQFTDFCRTMQVNHIYAGASAKGIDANIIDPTSIGNVCQSGTARKSTFADFRETVRKFERLQTLAICKCIIPNLGQSGRENNRFKIGQAIEQTGRNRRILAFAHINCCELILPRK